MQPLRYVCLTVITEKHFLQTVSTVLSAAVLSTSTADKLLPSIIIINIITKDNNNFHISLELLYIFFEFQHLTSIHV